MCAAHVKVGHQYYVSRMSEKLWSDHIAFFSLIFIPEKYFGIWHIKANSCQHKWKSFPSFDFFIVTEA